MNLNFGRCFGKMKNRRFKISTYLVLILIGSSLVTLLSSFVANFVLTKDLFFHELEVRQDLALNLFINNISHDLKFGLRPEIFRACKGLLSTTVLGVQVTGSSGEVICDFSAAKEHSFSKRSGDIYFDSEKKNTAGTIDIYFSRDSEEKIYIRMIGSILLGFSVVFLIVIIPLFKISKWLSNPVGSLSEVLSSKNLEQIKNYSQGRSSSVHELNELYVAIGNMASNNLKYEKEMRENEKNDSLYQQANRIVHDIRNPFLRLKLKVERMGLEFKAKSEINADIEMIDGLTQKMLGQYKLGQNFKNGPKEYPVEMLSILKKAVENSKLQTFEKIKIELNTPKSHDYLYVDSSSFVLSRIFLNIIKNAWEAIAGQEGKISVKVVIDSGQILIHVKDNGVGIPKELIPKITEQGYTFGKKHGTGLGLSFCSDEIKKINGKLQIESEINQGTTVTIALPLVKTPIWSTHEIWLHPSSDIVVVDDDRAIHDYWNDLAQIKNFKSHDINVIHFETLRAFKDFMEQKQAERKKLFIFDYDLKESQNGLDLIHNYKLMKSSILVSNHYDDSRLLSDCRENAIKFVPKQSLLDLKIEIVLATANTQNIAILDDDQSLLDGLKSFLDQQGIEAKIFQNYIDLKNAKLPFGTPILVDKNLGNFEDGLFVSRDLSNLGYKNLYLFTGEELINSNQFYWIRGLISKSDPESIRNVVNNFV